MLGRRHVRVAHAEIDDVLAAGPRFGLELVNLLEDIRRKPANAVELAWSHGSGLGSAGSGGVTGSLRRVSAAPAARALSSRSDCRSWSSASLDDTSGRSGMSAKSRNTTM